MRIREEVGKYIQRLQQLAQAIATVDVLQSLASVAESQQLNRPLFHEERRIEIDKGRHPVVEKVMGPSPIFLIASLWMKNGIFSWLRGQIWVGSLPICANWRSLWILAQIGSYVPAAKGRVANLWCDLYPNRSCWWPGIGSVYLYGGNDGSQSRHSQGNTPVLDFVWWVGTGNGDLWWDGPRQSIIEYIHDRTGAKTLFCNPLPWVDGSQRPCLAWKMSMLRPWSEMVRLPSCTRLNPAQQINPMGFTWPRSLVYQKNCWSGRMRFWPSSKDKPSKYRLQMQLLKGSVFAGCWTNVPLWGGGQKIQWSQNWKIWISTIWLPWKPWWQSPNWKEIIIRRSLVMARIFFLVVSKCFDWFLGLVFIKWWETNQMIT